MRKQAIPLSAPTAVQFAGSCGLSLCRLEPCPLPTHWAYVDRAWAAIHRTDRPPTAVASTQLLEQAHGDQEARSSDSEISSLTRLVDLGTQHIGRQITNGLPSIPLKTRYVRECGDLIDYYFNVQLHHRLRIYFPHVDQSAHIRSQIVPVYTNPVMSIVALSNSQAHKLMLSRARAADRTTQIVYGIVLQELRERMRSVLPGDTSLLLCLVMALVGLEFYLNSRSGLKMHREAIQSLVAMQGSIDTFGGLAGYILNIDRFIAICLGEYPLYMNKIVPRRPVRPVGKYGKAFAELGGTVDPMAIAFLQDQCRLIDVLETNRVNLMDNIETNSSRLTDRRILPYFLALREKGGADFAHLHAYYHDNQANNSDPLSTARTTGISRCVVLGGYVISYAVVLGDYYTMMRPMIGSELEAVLDRRSRALWKGNEDVVIWLLFALATIPKWSEHEQVMVKLREWLSSTYTESWPQGNWMAETARRLKDFVWCDMVFMDSYRTICEELLELEAKPTPVELVVLREQQP